MEKDITACDINIDEFLSLLEQEAKEEHIPIVRPLTLEALLAQIKRVEPVRILEIGTAIGYSGLRMLAACEAELHTVEIDSAMADRANDNFEKVGLLKRVYLHNCDALDFLKNNNLKFDFVFLDGAKSRYKEYFEYIDRALNVGGVIFADNVLYLGLVQGTDYPPHKHRTIVNAMRAYIAFMQEENRYKFELFNIEDGFAVSVKLR